MAYKETQNQNKTLTNLLKDKSASIPESKCLKSKGLEIGTWIRGYPGGCNQNMNIGLLQ